MAVESLVTVVVEARFQKQVAGAVAKVGFQQQAAGTVAKSCFQEQQPVSSAPMPGETVMVAVEEPHAH